MRLLLFLLIFPLLGFNIPPVQAVVSLPIQVSGHIVDGSQPPISIQSAPNDPYYSQQWYLSRIKAQDAWNITHGTNMVIAVIDTGLDLQHPDFGGKLWVNSNEIPNNEVDDDGNGYIDDYYGWNFYNGNNNIDDYHGHGTGISSIIAAQTNNQKGTAGINWNTRIMVLKALNNAGGGDFDDVSRAIHYAVDNGASIINMSFGSEINTSILSNAVDYAINRGVPMVAAVGNKGSNEIFYPAAYPQVIAVTAVDKNDAHPDFANTGSNIDLAAPGTEITMAGLVDGPIGPYVVGSGTSFAAAQVTAAASLILGRFQGMSSGVLENVLKAQSDVLASGTSSTTGSGVLNIYKALVNASNVESSNISVANGVVEADGVDTATVTVTVRDNTSRPRPNQEIVVHSNGSNTIINNTIVPATGSLSLGITNALGQITFEVASTKVGIQELTFTNSTTQSSLAGKAPIIFTIPADVCYSMQWVKQSPYPTLTVGSTSEMWVELKNTGNMAWVSNPAAAVDGWGQIKMGTDRPFDRHSSLRANSWLSDNRAGYMTPDIVLPGETARFTFDIYASTIGTFKEYFRPVVEYVTWLNDLGIYWEVNVEPVNGVTTTTNSNEIDVNPSHYQASIYSQGSAVTLSPGDITTLTITLTNIGSATWHRQGAGVNRRGEVRIGTADPRDRPSIFRNVSWISVNRVINSGFDIPPGGRLTLVFTIRAPSEPGIYRESFQLVSEYITWFGPTFDWTLTVI